MSTNNAQRSATKPAVRTPLWAKLLLLLVALLLIGAAGYAGFNAGKFFGASESRDTQVIRSIERQEQIILASAGVADVVERRGDGLKLGFFTLPGSQRATFLRYEFDAKFGIEGKDVRIQPTGEDAYRITVPEFIFLGYENPDVSLAKEENGLLSWTTPELDKIDIVESVLTDKAVASYIDGLRPVLEEQSKGFYSGIAHAINPDATLEFVFDGATPKDKK